MRRNIMERKMGMVMEWCVWRAEWDSGCGRIWVWVTV